MKSPEEIAKEINDELHPYEHDMRMIHLIVNALIEDRKQSNAIAAERATRPEPSKSFEEFYNEHDPHKTSIGTVKDKYFSFWQTAILAERARVREALPSEEIIQESRIAHKTNAKFWNDDIAFAAACYWLSDRIGVGAGEGK